MSPLVRQLVRFDARHRLACAVLLSGATCFALRHRVQVATQWFCTWDVFALVVLGLAWVAILRTPQRELRRKAKAQDVSSTVIFVFAIVSACAGLSAVGVLFYTNKAGHQPHLAGHLILSLIAVLSAWSLVHTVFSLRYAHKFYDDHPDAARDEHAGGLEFPKETQPNYLDFVYFSFVIGMTFQVSDVQIVSRDFRMLVLIHSVIAFAFNTVILALTINTLSSLI
ncbi:MAG: DUF1345 domain-containing protein [Verrucomicrobiota bacterium]|nr:DUF1345 domain-containing protein [Verrucomicrobiota bacterium]